MATVKFDDKKQKAIKVLSKILYLVGKISKILVRVAAGCLIFCMLVIPAAIDMIKVKDNKITIKDEYAKIANDSNQTNITFDGNDMVVKLKDQDEKIIVDLYNDYSKTTIIVLSEVIMLLLVGFLIILSLVLDRLDKLFRNIYNGETFTLDNVKHIRMMANFMVACLLINTFASFISTVFMPQSNLSISFINIVSIIFIYALSYVFEYGYELQKSSKSSMLDK